MKMGLRNAWLRGAAPLHADVQRVVGPAFTLRFVPAREDRATTAMWVWPCPRAGISTKTSSRAVTLASRAGAP